MIRSLLVVIGLFFVAVAGAAEDLSVLPANVDGAAPNQMMHGYLMRLAHEALDRRDAQYEQLETPEQLAEYQQQMRQFFVAALGGFPERTPLRPQIVAKEDRDGYRIEKVIFESQPQHFVTAILYLPDAEPPYPGVLVPCGHSDNGKAYDGYQRVSILLARNGMAALCYDPIDQGERFQLLDAGGKPVEGGTMAHCLLGVGSILLGRNTATYRVWDGMRAIDYLQSRPEIDPERIGCTGNSGGGTLTSYLMALDERITCAAPSCYLTSFRRLIETIGPQDCEQNIHAQIARGMGHADYVMMRAPKPTLLCAATRDFFDIGGTWTTFRQAKRFYTRMEFAERVDLIETDAQHGFSPQLRVGAVRWMRRWLLGIDDAITEPDAAVLSDQEALCTPKGQVMLLDGARSTFDLNAELEEKLAKARKQFWKETDKAQALDEVRRIARIRRSSELPEPECKTVATIRREGYSIEKLILEPEAGVFLPALAFVPAQRAGGDAYLYLNAAGKHVDAAPGGPIEKLVTEGHLVLAVDLRGLGETATSGDNRKYARYLGAEWVDNSLAYMLDRSYLAMRAEDVLGCARFLADFQAGEKPNRVHLTSIGLVGPPALHAAALEPELFASVTLKNCLVCWSDVVRTPLATNQYVNVVHGALRTYDLPDLLATLPKSKVTIVDPLSSR
ncbi:MAG TPA: acetylxylan esterase [Thermoguttaceae bacterium]|nr:acetylxylan esterase [Thermoguttaceae bacterium]